MGPPLLMPLPVAAADAVPLSVTAEPLTRAAFSPFGDVVENPAPSLHPSRFASSSAPGPDGGWPAGVGANQGSAVKYPGMSAMVDLYGPGGGVVAAPSRVAAKVSVAMFSCAARPLLPPPPPPREERAAGWSWFRRRRAGGAGVFPVRVLERHPFTPQTFVPLAPSSSAGLARYLVVVAPSLPPGLLDVGLPVPPPPPAVPSSSSSSSSSSPPPSVPHYPKPLPGRGLPDLARLRAFVATGRQAVTYGPGTWHAPMVALGTGAADGGLEVREETVDFVVVQFANGVAVEDCQEVVFGQAEEDRNQDGLAKVGALVQVPAALRGSVKAKL